MIVCNVVGKMFASGAFATLYVIIGDFFPTLLRNLSYSSSVPSRMITMLAPFLLFLGKHWTILRILCCVDIA